MQGAGRSMATMQRWDVGVGGAVVGDGVGGLVGFGVGLGSTAVGVAVATIVRVTGVHAIGSSASRAHLRGVGVGGSGVGDGLGGTRVGFSVGLGSAVASVAVGTSVAGIGVGVSVASGTNVNSGAGVDGVGVRRTRVPSAVGVRV